MEEYTSNPLDPVGKNNAWEEESNASLVQPIHLRIYLHQATQEIIDARLMVDCIVSGDSKVEIKDRKKDFAELGELLIIVNNKVESCKLDKGEESQIKHIQKLLKAGENLITIIPDRYCRIHMKLDVDYTILYDFIPFTKKQ